MRRKNTASHRQWPVRLWIRLLAAAAVLGTVGFNLYVEKEIKPTLLQLAEYEARFTTTRTVNEAVSTALQEEPELCDHLYRVEEGSVQLDTAAANQARSTLIRTVQDRLDALPEKFYYIPIGSLSGNSLLNGHGPGWEMQLKPQGYVQGNIEETMESLSINTTRCRADLVLSVTLNMVLDGRTETIDITDRIPLTSLLLQGETPAVYAAELD